MLTSLSIKNYAIIQQLEVQFSGGFCVITGETGAGKSIIMGALSLILGQRADTSVLKNNETKCIIEGRFKVNPTPELQAFFESNDLDYEMPILLRREITPAGKSRAFVNDTPVQLAVIRQLGLQLIDIHSQHSNLELGKRRFQLNVIDWYAQHDQLIANYKQHYQEWRKLEKEYASLVEQSEQAKADLDYFEFQFKQLDEARLVEGELEELESEQEVLSHSEEIKMGLSQAYQLLDNDEFAVLPKLKEALFSLSKIADYHPEIKELTNRIDSQYIELQDVAGECEQLAERTEHDPGRLEEITDRLNTLYGLFQKHRTEKVEELIALRNELDDKIQSAASFDFKLEQLQKEIQNSRGQLEEFALKLTKARSQQFPKIEKEITGYLKELGMPHAVFSIQLNALDEFQSAGKDEVIFQFAANKGGNPEEITRVASGGELSRLMLAIKTVVAKSKALPAIVFDEIDTGISGEVALKMGDILKNMSKYMQVINITHLPQIAAKGDTHFEVYKNENSKGVETGMRLLNDQDRVVEVAKMLSGANPSAAAIENAKVLMSGV